MLDEHLLNFDIVQELVVLRQDKYFKSLWPGYETTLDPESFFSDFLAAGVGMLLRVYPIVLLCQITKHLM